MSHTYIHVTYIHTCHIHVTWMSIAFQGDIHPSYDVIPMLMQNNAIYFAKGTVTPYFTRRTSVKSQEHSFTRTGKAGWIEVKSWQTRR